MYEYYWKPMANPLLMVEISAMPTIMKRTALTQEVVRIMRNTHPDLPWTTTVSHLNHFSECMRLSGYKQEYRYQVLKSGVEGYEKMFDIEKSGGRPVNRPRTWEEDRRQRKKELEKRNWLERGGFRFPCLHLTPQGGN